MLTSEMLARFIKSKRAAGASERTIRWYRSLIGQFAIWVDDQPEQEIDVDVMEAYLVHLRNERPLASASIASAARAIRTFFNFCVAKRLMTTNPMNEIRLMKVDPKEPRRATREEVDILLSEIPVNDWIGLRDYLIIHVLFFCGLRVGELVRLEASHFDLAQEILHIPGGKTGAGMVPLLQEVIEAFMAYTTHRPKTDEQKLFLSSDGHGQPIGPLTEHGVRHMIRRRCKEVGIRHLNPHAMRHGLAMHLLNDKRVDASLVQKILRHSDIKTTTNFYARWLIGAVADEYKARMRR
jgi:site-specific recombinase XerD